MGHQVLLVDRQGHRVLDPRPKCATINQQVVQDQDPEYEPEHEPHQALGQRHPRLVEEPADADPQGGKQIVDRVDGQGQAERLEHPVSLVDSILALLEHVAQATLGQLGRAQLIDPERFLRHLLSNEVKRHQQDHQQDDTD